MAQLSSGLYVKPIGRSSGGLIHGLSVNAAGFNGHVRSARKSRLSSGVGSRHVCSVAAVDPLVIEETVDGHAVLEQPGSLPSSQFEAFDQATNLVEDLETLNAQMAELITKASIAVEVQQETSKWAGNTLPSDTYAAFKRVFREDRKKVEQENKANRRLKRVMRAAGSSLAQPPSPQQSLPDTFLTAEQQLSTQQQLPAAAIEQQQIADSEIQALDAIERRAKRAQQREQRSQSAAPAAPPVQQAALDQQPQRASSSHVQRLPKPAVQQPAGRSRRRRGSSGVSAAAATPAGLQASSSSSVQEMELPAQQEATASRGGPAGPRPASARAIDAPPQAYAMTAVKSSPAGLAQSTVSSSSSSLDSSLHVASSSNSPAVASRRQAARGFQPLSLQQSSLAAPARSSMSSRTARAVGISGRSRATATASAAAVAAGSLEVASNLPKLVDNNMHGLDMRMDLLSAEQEKELAVMVQDLLKLEDKQRELTQQLGRLPTDVEWMEAVGAGPKDDSEEEYKAAAHTFQARLKHGRTAKQVMISANYKLVVAITRKYQGYGMSASDLINEGIAGLVKGVERFEPSKGCKFSTYAHWWIRQAITRSLSDQGRLVRLPAHLQEMLTKMTKVSRTFEGQYGREPTLDELARELGLEPSKIQDAYEAVFTPRSLDAPMADGEGATLGDVIEDERMLDAEDAAYMESLKADLEAVLLTLPPREAGVLRMRFGLLDGTEHTLDDIGAQYNVTRERIRQIEAKAIRQLRARQSQPGSVMADYQLGGMEAKELASRTSSGTKKQG